MGERGLVMKIHWIVLISVSAALLPAKGLALTCELGGAFGYPVSVSSQDHRSSLGWSGTLFFHSPGPTGTVGVGAGVEYNRFDAKHGDGSRSFSGIHLDLRAAFVRKKTWRAFVVFAPGLTIRTIAFSDEARASNPIIPASQSDINAGLGLGTGVSIRVAGDWLALVSTQTAHFAGTEVQPSTFLTASLGVVLSTQ